MTLARILYWFLTGGMIGFGLLAILSIGLPFLVLGIVLLIVGALRFGGKEVFAALVGFGALPAAIFIWDVTSGPWACDTGGFGSSSDGAVEVARYSCVDTPFGLLTTYHVMAAGFAFLALVGLVLLLFSFRRPARPAVPSGI